MSKAKPKSNIKRRLTQISQGVSASSYYSLTGWALFIIMFSVALFIPWAYNDFLLNSWSWNWIIVAFAIFMVIFGLLTMKSRGYSWIGIGGWVALSILLCVTFYAPSYFGSAFYWLQRMMGSV